MTSIASENATPEQCFGFLRAHPEYGSKQKADNYAQLAEARARGDLVVNAAPAYIRFELHARCNLRCCWAQRTPTHPALRPRGAANLDLAKRILDEVGSTLYEVILCHWGEPTLNRDLPEFVRLFHDANIHTTFDTNMTLMTAELAGALVDAGLDRISASIDGVSQDAYGQYRIGGKVDAALAGLRDLVEQRQQRMRTNPHIRWQFLVFPHNEHEVGLARQLAHQIGIDTFDAFGGGARQWTPESGFLPPTPPQRPTGLLCSDPWTYLAVDWDGAVHLCCRAFQAQHVMGHMSDATMTALFDNARFQLARRVIRDGVWAEADGPIPCTGCNRIKRFVPAIADLNHVLTLT
ncbi:MAG: radical SAM protein [Phycisphaerae bacterium]|nr:radical SAM protein [Phycisphaerae bacterium]